MPDPNSSLEDIFKVTTSKILTLDEIPFTEQMDYLAIAAILAVFSEVHAELSTSTILEEE